MTSCSAGCTGVPMACGRCRICTGAQDSAESGHSDDQLRLPVFLRRTSAMVLQQADLQRLRPRRGRTGLPPLRATVVFSWLQPSLLVDQCFRSPPSADRSTAVLTASTCCLRFARGRASVAKVFDAGSRKRELRLGGLRLHVSLSSGRSLACLSAPHSCSGASKSICPCFCSSASLGALCLHT